MLRVFFSAMFALSSYVSANFDVESIRTAFVEMLILGRIPFLPFEVTFDMIFVLFITAIVFLVISKLSKKAKLLMQTTMWNVDYLESISI